MQISLPTGWVWRKARDCMDVRDGTHDSPKYVPSGYPLVTSKNLVNGQIDFSTCSFISKEDFDAISKRSAVDDGDILYAMIGTIGNPVIVQKQIEFAIKNVALFKFNNQNVNNRYVYHFLNSELAINQFSSNARGGTQKFVSLNNIRDLKIPLPPFAEQQKIAAILDATDSLRQKDKQLVERYNALSKSLFLEMFGDPVTNPMGWNQLNLNNIVSKLGDGLHGTPEYSDDGEYFFINGNNLNHGTIEIYPETKKVSESEFNKHKKELTETTMLVSINGSIGKVAFYNGEKVILGKSACYFNIKESLINRLYLFHLIESPYFLNYAMGSATGSTIKNVSLKTMRELPVPIPPMSMQIQFAEHIQLIEMQKKQAQLSLEKSEALFNSLLQHAFTGELTAKMAA